MASRKESAGLLMYRAAGGALEVFLAHPGGPLFRNKDDGAWTIPKGEIDGDDEPLATAQREFEEETGITPRGEYRSLGSVRQKGGKLVRAWAFACPDGYDDSKPIRSNTFTMEWPPRSGKQQEFPEVDAARFALP